jgi:protein subunit release factor A
MTLNPADVHIGGEDQRKGMGIGGYHVAWTATHTPTGCAVTWVTMGGEPQAQNKMRDRALMALELMTEVYPQLRPAHE